MVYRAEVSAGETSGTVEIYYTEAKDIKAATAKVLATARKEYGQDMRVKKVEEVPGRMAA